MQVLSKGIRDLRDGRYKTETWIRFMFFCTRTTRSRVQRVERASHKRVHLVRLVVSASTITRNISEDEVAKLKMRLDSGSSTLYQHTWNEQILSRDSCSFVSTRRSVDTKTGRKDVHVLSNVAKTRILCVGIFLCVSCLDVRHILFFSYDLNGCTDLDFSVGEFESLLLVSVSLRVVRRIILDMRMEIQRWSAVVRM